MATGARRRRHKAGNPGPRSASSAARRSQRRIRRLEALPHGRAPGTQPRQTGIERIPRSDGRGGQVVRGREEISEDDLAEGRREGADQDLVDGITCNETGDEIDGDVS